MNKESLYGWSPLGRPIKTLGGPILHCRIQSPLRIHPIAELVFLKTKEKLLLVYHQAPNRSDVGIPQTLASLSSRRSCNFSDSMDRKGGIFRNRMPRREKISEYMNWMKPAVAWGATARNMCGVVIIVFFWVSGSPPDPYNMTNQVQNNQKE